MPPVKKPKAKKVKTEENGSEKKETAISGQLLKKMKKAKNSKPKKERGVVFIKHLPHGFFEEQLRKYFEQFGKVTNLRLVRSRRTGGSRGYAFIEFAYPEVAQVAAETMDNYLMFQKLVKADYIPPEKQVYNYFKSGVRKVKNSAGKTIFVSHKMLATKRKADRYNEWSDKRLKKNENQNLQKIKNLNEKYAHLGIDFASVCMGPKQEVEKEKKEKVKKSKDEMELIDLLGQTIAEDSEDDEWAGSDLEFEENSIEEDDEEEEEEEEIETPKKIVGKKAKSLVSNEERIDKIIKRKPQSGGIKKAEKKPAKKPTPLVLNPKKAAILSSAKEMAKTIPKGNLTSKKPTSQKKNLKKKVK